MNATFTFRRQNGMAPQTTERQRQVARLRAALSGLRCWGVAESYRKGKKIMQKVCDDDGNQKIVHAGGANTKYDGDPKKIAAVRKLQKCDADRPKRGTARYLVCEHLWNNKKKA